MATKTEKEKLYLRSWEYNAAIILDHLETIVLNKGGKIVSTWDTRKDKKYLITNRSLSAAIREKRELAERLTRYNRPTTEEAQKELKRMEEIPNEPRESRNGSYLYLQFVLDDVYYSYNMNDNPFFDFSFSKIPVLNGFVDTDKYCIPDNKEWFLDCLWSFNCTETTRQKTALKIFKMLTESVFSQPYTGKGRPKKLYILEDGKQ